MDWTDRLEKLLRMARRYKFVNRAIVQAKLFPEDKDGSVARDFLRKAVREKLLRRIDPTNEFLVLNAPVYVPTEQGCCLLATRAEDMSLLLDRPPNTRNPQDFPHHLAVTRLLLLIDRAFSAQSYATCVALATEHDLLGEVPLFTEIGCKKKVVCAPDFALLMQIGPYRRYYGFESETGADAPTRAMNRKAPGWAGLAETGKFRLAFPAAQDMRAVFVCPNPAWRESMRKAALKLPGRENWLFAARGEITEQTLLHGEIFHPAEGNPRALAGPATAPQGEPGRGADRGARR